MLAVIVALRLEEARLAYDFYAVFVRESGDRMLAEIAFWGFFDLARNTPAGVYVRVGR